MLRGDEGHDFTPPADERCPECGRHLESFDHCYACGWDLRESSEDKPVEVDDEDIPPHSD